MLGVGHGASEQSRLLFGQENVKWQFRPPPWGLGRDGYDMCPRILTGVPCRLAEQCSNAHSQEELLEWQVRSEVRQKTHQEHNNEASYRSTLQRQVAQAESIEDIFSEDVGHARYHIGPVGSSAVVCRDAQNEWTISVTAKVGLHWISLFDTNVSSEFNLASVTFWSMGGKSETTLPPHCQEWRNVDGIRMPHAGDIIYIIKVSFVSCVFGTFNQRVVLDFGFRPMLVVPLKVEVVPDLASMRALDYEETLVCSDVRWDHENSFLVPFQPSADFHSPTDEQVIARYPPPRGPVPAHVEENVLSKALSYQTYQVRLHHLLYAEEWAQTQLLFKYNIETELQLVESYWLTGADTTAKFCVTGEMFAHLCLHRRLTEDTAAGRIILNGCSVVLITPCQDPVYHNGKRKVYESVIEGKCKDNVYLRISADCVRELNLKPTEVLKAEVQFRLDRLPLCELHHAVDELPDLSFVFPKIDTYPNISWPPQSRYDEHLDPRLNAKQKEAICAMMMPLTVRLPPILLMGPYGTGKTFTLAQGIKLLLQHTEARILVCTHSNSAADLYVRDYLHGYVEGGLECARPLRVYYRHRRVETVHPTVLKYCILQNDPQGRVFRKPTAENVMERRVVVVTLATSRCLTELRLVPGYFTHIVLDEAAQVMECEAINPFAMVSMNTRIIMAGDHMQLSPEVHSSLARQHGLQVSLLERLFDLYPPDYPCSVLLCENYRSHPAIVEFTSKLFYQNKLRATSRSSAHPEMHPLTFCTAKGEEIQDSNSTTYRNNAEIYEIVDKVLRLRDTWPSSWGPMNDASIGVVTPYADQVFQIRAALRQKKLSYISVERVLNIQGKQFRAIIMSTVRTRHTCNGREDKFFQNGTSGEGTVAIRERKLAAAASSERADEDEEQDFGFLSNAKLLVTAITRAQSLVIVVGDPVALCSVGKCRKLWEQFLEQCHKSNSLTGTTYRKVCVELENLELGISSSLDPKAPIFVPRTLGSSPSAAVVASLHHQLQHQHISSNHPLRPSSPHHNNPHPMMQQQQLFPFVAAFNNAYPPLGPPNPSGVFNKGPGGGNVSPQQQHQQQHLSNSPVRPSFNAMLDSSRMRMLLENQQQQRQQNGFSQAQLLALANDRRAMENSGGPLDRMNEENLGLIRPMGRFLTGGGGGGAGSGGMENGEPAMGGGGGGSGRMVFPPRYLPDGAMMNSEPSSMMPPAYSMERIALEKALFQQQQQQNRMAAMPPSAMTLYHLQQQQRALAPPHLMGVEEEEQHRRVGSNDSPPPINRPPPNEVDYLDSLIMRERMRNNMSVHLQHHMAQAAAANGSRFEQMGHQRPSKAPLHNPMPGAGIGGSGGGGNGGGGVPSNSHYLLSYAEAVRTSTPQSVGSPISVVADFEQRVAPRTSNGLYRYF